MTNGLEQMNQKRAEILSSLRSNKISGKKCAQMLSAAMDTFLKNLADSVFHTPHLSAVLALGGYGRKELCPHSDIDLLFLVQENLTKDEEKNIETFLYTIWDSGIKIGHSVRTPRECIEISQQDPKAMSNLLDARLIWGDDSFFEGMMNGLKDNWAKKTRHGFTEAKLEERDNRHRRLGDTRYVLEPNIKEGKGGLRDYQTLFWITQVLYDVKSPTGLAKLNILTQNEKSKFRRAHEFLLTIRCHIHDIAGRAEERLHFDIQPQLAERLGYKNKDNSKAVERFMKHYFRVTRDIGDLTRIVCAAIDENSKTTKIKKLESYPDYEIDNDRLNFSCNLNLNSKPIEIIRIFRIAQKTGLDIHPAALRKITQNIALIDQKFCAEKQANDLFLNILSDRNDAYIILRRMNEAGVLERFIPEFRKAIALMQFDRYHVFTVDEHTLHAIDIAHKIENGDLRDICSLPSALIHEIQNRRILFVALLLHDLCKGRGGNHEQLGAELALKVCPRLGLNDAETRLCSWLIFDHLLMSQTAFKRDIQDPKTIENFMFRIHDQERLALLTVFTAIDIMAVGPGRYTPWKDTLLQDLYYKCEQAIQGNRQSSRDVTPNEIQVPDALPAVYISNSEEHSATIVDIYASDHDGLFSLLTGALTAARVSILEARINTLNGKTAHDVFTIQNSSGKPLSERRYTEIKDNILGVLNGTLDLGALLGTKEPVPSKRDMVFEIPYGVTLHSRASESDIVLEIYGRDRMGLLYDISRLMKKHGYNIQSAKINTYGLKAVDVFYIQKNAGTPDKLVELINSINVLLSNYA